MKYLIIIFAFLLNTSCSQGDKKTTENTKQIIPLTRDSIDIKNIKKTCYQNINKNIFEFVLCSDWSLSETKIKEIVSLGKKNNSSEVLNLLANENKSWINADIIIKAKTYKIEINPISYYFLTDNKGNKELYTFDTNASKKVQNYFLRILSEDDDINYINKLNNVKNKIDIQKINLTKWEGTFNFDNNNYDQLYKKYTLNINSDKIVFYEGNLPGCEIYCIPYISEGTLYLYFDGEKTNCDGYDTSMIDKLQDGDLLFKLFIKNNKRYIQSHLLKYWNNETSNFEENIQISLTK